MLIYAILKFLSISHPLVSLLFFSFGISITSLSTSVILFCCSLALLSIIFRYLFVVLFVYVSVIVSFVIFIQIFIYLIFFYVF